MSRAAPLLSVVIAMLALACERETVAPAPADTQPTRPTVEFSPVAPLLPARRTHVAVDARANVFWSQEHDSGDDVVFSLGDDGVPRATSLSAAAVLAETREAGGSSATGNLQSLAFGPDGALYFYVSGGTDRRTIAALGRFVPATSTIELIAPTKALMSAAGMGRDLALARGTVVVSGKRIVFWLRHTDTSAMFEIDTPADGAKPQLKRLPEPRTERGPLRLTREEQFLAPGQGGALLLLHLSSAALVSIDPTGKASVVHELQGLPRALSLPALDPRGRVIVFAGSAPAIDPRTEEQAALSMIEFPALLTLGGGEPLHRITRKDMTAHAGFPIAGAKLQQLVPDRSPDAYVAYDESSGELLRLHVRRPAEDAP